MSISINIIYAQDGSSMASTNKWGEKISQKSIKELIGSGSVVLRNDLRTSKDDTPWDFYLMENGKLLLYDPIVKTGVLYHSPEHLLAMRAEIKKRVEQQFPNKDVTKGILPIEYIKSTREAYELLLESSPDELCAKLGMDPGMLDFSVSSLTTVSNKLNQLILVKERYDLGVEYLDLLSAYSGETIRRKVNGEWVIKDDNGRLTALEIVNPKSGETYNPYWFLIKTFFDSSSRIDLKNEIEAEVLKHGLFKK